MYRCVTGRNNLKTLLFWIFMPFQNYIVISELASLTHSLPHLRVNILRTSKFDRIQVQTQYLSFKVQEKKYGTFWAILYSWIYQFMKPPSDTLLRYINMFRLVPSLSSLLLSWDISQTPVQRVLNFLTKNIYKSGIRLRRSRPIALNRK